MWAFLPVQDPRAGREGATENGWLRIYSDDANR
jgi:hypothetical protein